jgi:hypothetical protein
MTNIDRYRSDLVQLLKLGREMQEEILERAQARSAGKRVLGDGGTGQTSAGVFELKYQDWYSEATAVVGQLLPSRRDEFDTLYKGDPKRKSIELETYTIKDWLLGVRASSNRHNHQPRFDDLGAMGMRFFQQLQILDAVQRRFDSSLFDIAQLARAELFDSELDAARELQRHGFLRPAGMIAGVVLEKHLQQVAHAHKLTMRKRSPTIADLNDPLKQAEVYDIPTWRQIQRLADLRNLCGHNKDREPTKDEVDELLDGVAKISKTVF